MAIVISPPTAAAFPSEHISFPRWFSSKRSTDHDYQALLNKTQLSANSPKNPNMSPRTETTQSPPPKDASDNNTTAVKKKAGRKKATQDGDAVERRRTQLRLAQRAYRERKETTIAGLEKKTASLERALSEMYDIFTDYHDTVTIQNAASGDVKLVRDLDQVREELNMAMHQAGVDPDSKGVVKRRRVRLNNPPASTLPMSEMNEMRQDSALPSRTAFEPVNPLGYAFGANPVTESHLFGNEGMSNTQDLSTQHRKDRGGTADAGGGSEGKRRKRLEDTYVQDGRSGMVVVYSSNWMNTAQLGGASGYRHETSSFSRRLFHFCLENCFRLLSDPRRNEEEITQKMRWSLEFWPREDILRKTVIYLQASEKQHGKGRPPDAGMLTLGGAGTHYPRPPYVYDWAKKYRVAEEADLTEAQKALFPNGLYKYTAVTQFDFPEGMLKNQFSKDIPWFDSYDTEMYLRQRGVKFNALSTSATIDISVEDRSPLKSSTPSAAAPVIEAFKDSYLAQQPNAIGQGINDTVNFEDIDWTRLGDWSMMQNTSNTTVPELSFDNSSLQTNSIDSSSLDATLLFDSPSPICELPDFDSDLGGLNVTNIIDPAQQVQPRPGPYEARHLTRTVTIDVDALLHLLENGAMCLGRAPGFRKSVVDDALDVIIREATQHDDL